MQRYFKSNVKTKKVSDKFQYVPKNKYFCSDFVQSYIALQKDE